jgi:N4-gp56 family major capsid protein
MLFNKIFGFALSLVGFGADVVTVTTGTVGSAGNVAADLQTYFSAKLLEVAELNTILNQFGEMTPIPSNSSKTIHFVREEKFVTPASPVQLTEGIAPDAVGLTLNQFEATAEQYGFLSRISDLGELTAKHPVVQKTMYLLSLQAAEIYDQLIFNVLNAATSIYYPNGKVSDATLTASDTIGYNDLVTLDALLNDAGGRPMDSGDYVLVTASQAYASILRDPDYKAAHQLVSPDKIYRGEVDQLAGFRVVRSNAPAFAATSQATTGAANKVYSAFAIAKSAYQISDLQNLKVYVVAPGGQSDPLQQSRKMGWKFAFKTIITNQTWIYKVRSAGSSSVNN